MENIKDIDIELKSEPMSEMLSHPPKWIIRSGSGLFTLMLVIIIGLSWFISYPDEIIGEVTVSTTEPPIELNNQIYVQLKRLSIKEGQFVHKNQIIAEFDNQALPGDIQKAQSYLKRLKGFESNPNKLLPPIQDSLQLGSFQESWTGLENKIVEWNQILSSKIEQEQLSAIQREINYRERLQNISNKKIKLSEAEYNLIAEELKTSQQLSENNAISRQTLNQDKHSENQAMQTIQTQKEQFVQNLIQLNSLRKELLKLKDEQKLKLQQRISGIHSTISNLELRFIEWHKSAVWVAPCSGKVIFNKHLQLHKFYNAGEASIVIVPNGNKFMALATIESAGAGKVKKGQKVFIELTDYPKNDFGMIEGLVSHITQIEKEGKYEVKISLPKQLKTSYNQQIPAKAQLKGQIKIITKNKRLLARFFEKITNLIK